jgi:hypothetical protein
MQSILFHALALFCCCLALHIVIWRLFSPQNQLRWLSAIFLLGPLLLLGRDMRSLGGLSCGLVLLLHYVLSGVYLSLYTMVAGFSPSIGILERVDEGMPQGLERHELAPPWFNDKNLSGARRENLLASGLIHESRGVLHLSSRGRLIARCFLLLRRVLGLPDVAKG